MNIYHGVLKKLDLGAGGWQLHCNDGSIYDLYGDIPANLQDKKVKVKASTIAGAGFLMSGSPKLSVDTIEPI